MMRIMTELILRECMKKAQADYDSSLAKPKIDINAKIKLSKEHLKELRNNAYSGSEEEHVIDHIAKVLKILDSIKIPNVDTDQLCMHFFLSRLLVLHENGGYMRGATKSPPEVNLMGNNELMDDIVLSDEEWENNELMDDILSSDKESKESDNGNPPNTDTDLFFKPYLDA
ncbi:hypothetical protein Tco_0065746 [Tanacetum coccineum]